MNSTIFQALMPKYLAETILFQVILSAFFKRQLPKIEEEYFYEVNQCIFGLAFSFHQPSREIYS